jgi:hypothetical protein
VAADKAAPVKLIGVEGTRVVYEVGSGRYQFRVTARRQSPCDRV